MNRQIPITWRQWDRMMHHGWLVAVGLWTARGHAMLMRRGLREICVIAVD